MARKFPTCKALKHKVLCAIGGAPFLYAPALPPRPSVQERAGRFGNRTPAAPSPDRGRRRCAPGLRPYLPRKATAPPPMALSGGGWCYKRTCTPDVQGDQIEVIRVGRREGATPPAPQGSPEPT